MLNAVSLPVSIPRISSTEAPSVISKLSAPIPPTNASKSWALTEVLRVALEDVVICQSLLLPIARAGPSMVSVPPSPSIETVTVALVTTTSSFPVPKSNWPKSAERVMSSAPPSVSSDPANAPFTVTVSTWPLPSRILKSSKLTASTELVEAMVQVLVLLCSILNVSSSPSPSIEETEIPSTFISTRSVPAPSNIAFTLADKSRISLPPAVLIESKAPSTVTLSRWSLPTAFSILLKVTLSTVESPDTIFQVLSPLWVIANVSPLVTSPPPSTSAVMPSTAILIVSSPSPVFRSLTLCCKCTVSLPPSVLIWCEEATEETVTVSLAPFPFSTSILEKFTPSTVFDPSINQTLSFPCVIVTRSFVPLVPLMVVVKPVPAISNKSPPVPPETPPLTFAASVISSLLPSVEILPAKSLVTDTSSTPPLPVTVSIPSNVTKAVLVTRPPSSLSIIQSLPSEWSKRISSEPIPAIIFAAAVLSSISITSSPAPVSISPPTEAPNWIRSLFANVFIAPEKALLTSTLSCPAPPLTTSISLKPFTKNPVIIPEALPLSVHSTESAVPLETLIVSPLLLAPISASIVPVREPVVANTKWSLSELPSRFSIPTKVRRSELSEPST